MSIEAPLVITCSLLLNEQKSSGLILLIISVRVILLFVICFAFRFSICNPPKVFLNLWKKIKISAINGRRTGLGPTAIGDTVAALGIKYGSDESIKIVEEIYNEKNMKKIFQKK